MNVLRKIIDIATDNRLPHFLPYNIAKSTKMKLQYKKPEFDKIFISLTFDVERDFDLENTKAMRGFIKKAKALEKITKSNLTLFIQGDMVSEFAKDFKNLSGNEFGLHGFSHELWGTNGWWLNRPIPSYSEKVELIKRGLGAFDENGLERPKSFRSPYLVVNDETLKLIQKFGFTVDSSFPSYRGVEPVPRKIGGVFEVPVTSNPIPKLSKGSLLPSFYYESFNLKTIVDLSKDQIFDFFNRVAFFQQRNGVIPHLIFLAHPWEFMSWEKKGYGYCSEENFGLIKNVLSNFERNFEVEYCKVSEIPERVMN